MKTLLSTELKEKVTARIQECLDIAEKTFGQKFDLPLVRYDIRSTVGGIATFSKWRVRFNLIFLVENEDEYLQQVVPHEVAHLINRKVNKVPDGRKRLSSHGKEWAQVMELFGLKPDVTHCFDCTSIEPRIKEDKPIIKVSKVQRIITQMRKLDDDEKAYLVDRIDNGALYD